MYKNEKYLTNLKESAISFNNSDTLSLLEITKIQLPHLLRYEDRSSMRHSIETRLPFLDYRLVEFCVSLPNEMKMKNGWMKFILRRVAQKFIPESVAWRKTKFGFEAPDKIWLTKHHSQMLNDIKESVLLNKYCDHETLVKNYDKLSLNEKWMYFVIARWERVYSVSSPKI
jgi:asparagine synthase (glutamine-hydrolysing)